MGVSMCMTTLVLVCNYSKLKFFLVWLRDDEISDFPAICAVTELFSEWITLLLCN